MDFSPQFDDLQKRVAQAKGTAQSAAAESRDQLKRRIDQAQDDVDQAVAWTVSSARLDVLDAIDARAYADERAKAAGAR